MESQGVLAPPPSDGERATLEYRSGVAWQAAAGRTTHIQSKGVRLPRLRPRRPVVVPAHGEVVHAVNDEDLLPACGTREPLMLTPDVSWPPHDSSIPRCPQCVQVTGV